MTRSTTLYIAMFAVLIVGLWGILTLGGRLQAPHDLTGVWEFRQPGADPQAATKTFTVDQSGRFVRLHFSATEAIDLRWVGEERDATSGSRVVRLEGPGHALTVRVLPGDPPAGPSYRFELGGTTQRAWLARRQDQDGNLVPEGRHK